jgi:hypothetical protein
VFQLPTVEQKLQKPRKQVLFRPTHRRRFVTGRFLRNECEDDRVSVISFSHMLGPILRSFKQSVFSLAAPQKTTKHATRSAGPVKARFQGRQRALCSFLRQRI